MLSYIIWELVDNDTSNNPSQKYTFVNEWESSLTFTAGYVKFTAGYVNFRVIIVIAR